MANNFILLGTIGAIGWIFISGPPPIKPIEPSPLSRVATNGSSASPYASTGSSPAINTRRDPVPLVRNVRVPPASPVPSASSDAPPARVEHDELDRRAAKAAAENDGYRRVSIVGRASNGAWRATGYRGTTEVLLTIDGIGRVFGD